ncbi:MAG: FAD-binding protein [Stellaceae bacterium]
MALQGAEQLGPAMPRAARRSRRAGGDARNRSRGPKGGNSAFTGGAFRVVYHGAEDLARLIPDMNEHELSNVDFGTYDEGQYFDDMGRLTQYRLDPDMTEILVHSSYEAALWMRQKGVRFQLGLGRQAFRVDGKFKFWGGLACQIWGGGKELIKALHARAARDGITMLCDTPTVRLLTGDRGIEGVRVRREGRLVDLRAKTVVPACGAVGERSATGTDLLYYCLRSR